MSELITSAVLNSTAHHTNGNAASFGDPLGAIRDCAGRDRYSAGWGPCGSNLSRPPVSALRGTTSVGPLKGATRSRGWS